jgi:hypothetical protein
VVTFKGTELVKWQTVIDNNRTEKYVNLNQNGEKGTMWKIKSQTLICRPIS